MARTPRGALQLVAEVKEKFPDALVIPTEVDGFGVYRTFLFESEVAGWLEPVLKEAADKRIIEVSTDEDGVLLVRFSSRSQRADDSAPFNLADHATVVEEKPKPAAKRAAKKSAD